jgi:hypothetical protein
MWPLQVLECMGIVQLLEEGATLLAFSTQQYFSWQLDLECRPSCILCSQAFPAEPSSPECSFLFDIDAV